MRPKFVPTGDVVLVRDGLEKFFKQCSDNREFDAEAMREFMEPIFEQAGYRSLLRLHEPDERANILLIHDSGVGDFVLMSAALRELRRIYPSAHITLLLHPTAKNLAEHCPYVDEIIPNIRAFDWHEFHEVYRQNMKMTSTLLSRRYDAAYAFTHYPSTVLMAYMSGARERVSHEFFETNEAFEVGSLSAFAPLVTKEAPKWIYGTHAIETNLALLSAVTYAPITNREAEVWYTPFDRAAAEYIFRARIPSDRKTYALCFGGIGQRKKWPPERYAALAKLIVEQESDVHFMILGGGEQDVEAAEIFMQSLDEDFRAERVINLTNECSYRVSSVLLSFCDMYIGNDTSTLHMAAAMKVPVLTPSCFAADNDIRFNVLDIYYPYHVPSVTVLAPHGLDECGEQPQGIGCLIDDRPHCIMGIEVETMFNGYNMLKDQIEKNDIEPVFVT